MKSTYGLSKNIYIYQEKLDYDREVDYDRKVIKISIIDPKNKGIYCIDTSEVQPYQTNTYTIFLSSLDKGPSFDFDSSSQKRRCIIERIPFFQNNSYMESIEYSSFYELVNRIAKYFSSQELYPCIQIKCSESS